MAWNAVVARFSLADQQDCQTWIRHLWMVPFLAPLSSHSPLFASQQHCKQGHPSHISKDSDWVFSPHLRWFFQLALFLPVQFVRSQLEVFVNKAEETLVTWPPVLHHRYCSHEKKTPRKKTDVLSNLPYGTVLCITHRVALNVGNQQFHVHIRYNFPLFIIV